MFSFIAGSDKDPKGWAKRLRERERAGESLSIVQRQFWREALKHENDESRDAEQQP